MNDFILHKSQYRSRAIGITARDKNDEREKTGKKKKLCTVHRLLVYLLHVIICSGLVATRLPIWK